MSKNARKSNTTSILDYLFILLFAFIVLFMISSPKEPIKRNDIIEKAEFMIEISWDDKSMDDVDTFFITPTGEHIWYANKKAGVYNLDRDDQGTSTDYVTMPDGSVKVIYINREVLTLRGYSPGEYRLNVFMYNKRDAGSTNVKAKILKLNPYKIIYETDLVLSNMGEEQNIGNFTLDSEGNVVAFDVNFQSMLDELGLTYSGERVR